MLNDKLKELREESKKTTAELAAEMKVTRNTIYNWESGRTKPSNEDILRLAQGYGVRYDWLAFGKGEKTEALQQQKREENKAQGYTVKYNVADKRRLEDVELLIAHLRELNISKDEKQAIHLTLTEYRAELERKILFG